MYITVFLLSGIFSLILVISNWIGDARNQVKDFIAPPPLIEHYSIGMRPQLADLFWIRSLQDFSYCEEQIFRRVCRGNSWLFQMLNTTVTLDPEYKIVYSTGGLALTIIISDYAGASIIFDKGVEKFPEDWPLLYKAGYHALYEERNFVKAEDLYRRAAENGGPDWIYKLADRLNSKQGRIALGERMLQDLIKREEDEVFIERMREKIEEVKNQPD